MLKLKKVHTHAVRKHKIITTLCAVLLLMPAVFTEVKFAQALNTGEYGEDDWFRTGHNWVVLNALELLKNDGYVTEAEAIEQYLKPVIDGSTDADKGSYHHGSLYSVPVWNQYDMTDIGGTGLDGGGMTHFFSPWNHQGIGPTENIELFQALADIVVEAIPGADVVLPLLKVPHLIDNWADWFGRNAAEATQRALSRAVQNWEAGYQDRAMYYLGMALHVLTDIAAVPHHANCILLDGHAEYEDFVDAELAGLLPANNLTKALEADTLYNVNKAVDHGIYLEDLQLLSDGVYIAGDTDQLTDTGSDIEGLRKGHIYQLPNPAYQFIDFAAHESIEWYPMVNADWGTDDFDDWWELWNYIEAPDLQKKRQGNQPDDNHVSRLIFHFEGVNTVTADFEGATHNWEAIDMENWWFKQLGYVAAWEGYDQNWLVGGPWVSEGGLWWGPEPTAYGTLQLETVVERGLNSLDKDCDGWQLSEIRVQDMVYPWSWCLDPLTREHDPTTRTYCIDSNGEPKALPLLDEDLVPDDMHSTARRVAAVHLMDLAYKLCAGMIKYFFDTVGLSVVAHPNTWLIPKNMLDLPGNPPSGQFFDYWDESGKVWYREHRDWPGTPAGELYVEQGRRVWVGNHLVFEPTGAGLQSIGYQVDDGDWVWKTIEESGIYSSTAYAEIPDDDLEHTIRYHSINREGQMEPVKTVIFQQDNMRPTVELTFGNPSRQVDGTWHITHDTPITLTASDLGGSGVEGIYYSIYSVEEEKWVVGGGEGHEQYPRYGSWVLWTLGGETYTNPFTFGGYQLIPYVWIIRNSSPGIVYGIFPWKWLDTELPAGTYRIYYNTQDHVYRFASYEWHSPLLSDYADMVEVELVDSMEGVHVQVEPYRFSAQPGDSVDYNVSICNWYQTSKTYDLAVEGLDPTSVTWSETSVTVGPDETANVTLTVSPPYIGLILKDYPFTVTATLQDSPEVSDTAEAILSLIFQPDPPAEPDGSLEVDVEPEPIPIGSAATASVQVVNNQNFDDLIAVSIDVDDIPENDQADLTWFSWGGIQIFAPAGSTTTIPLTVTVPDGYTIGCKMFDVRARSRTWPESEVVRRFRVTSDVTAPGTEILIGTPRYIDALGNTYVTSDTSFTLTTDDGPDGTGVEATYYRYYNLAYDSGWTDYADLFYLTELEDGSYSIDYNSIDVIGNVEPTNTLDVILDNIPPTTTLTIGEPKYVDSMGNIYVSSATPFTLTAEDNLDGAGVASTFYRISNDTYETGWLDYSEPFYIAGLSDGEYVTEYYSIDTIGNTEMTNSTSVTLDNTPPNITILSPVDGRWYRGNDVPLDFTVDETTSWIGYSLDGEENITITGNIVLANLSYGYHNVTLYANDTCSNMGTSESVHFTVTGSCDLNCDGGVSMEDIAIASRAYGSHPGHSRWNPIVDINQDEKVDLIDISFIARNFGEKYT